MSRSSSPDRRPLLYGVAAVLILIAALFIFWPRGGNDDQPSFTLEAPTSEQSAQASATGGPNPGEFGSTDDPRAMDDPSANADQAATDTPAPETVQSAQLTQQQEFHQEEMPEPADAASTQTPQTTSSAASQNKASANSGSNATSGTSSQPVRGQTGTRSSSSGLTGPGPNGSYQIWAGSYHGYDNAQIQVKDLAKSDVESTVVEATASDGRTVYRVRIGFFAQKSQADAYARDLKSRLGLDYWIGQR